MMIRLPWVRRARLDEMELVLIESVTEFWDAKAAWFDHRTLVLTSLVEMTTAAPGDVASMVEQLLGTILAEDLSEDLRAADVEGTL